MTIHLLPIERPPARPDRFQVRLHIAVLTTLFLLHMFGTAFVAFHLGVFLASFLMIELAWMIIGVVVSLLLALGTWNYITKLREALK